MTTIKTKENGMREVENEFFCIELSQNQANALEDVPDGEISMERVRAALQLPRYIHK